MTRVLIFPSYVLLKDVCQGSDVAWKLFQAWRFLIFLVLHWCRPSSYLFYVTHVSLRGGEVDVNKKQHHRFMPDICHFDYYFFAVNYLWRISVSDSFSFFPLLAHHTGWCATLFSFPSLRSVTTSLSLPAAHSLSRLSCLSASLCLHTHALCFFLSLSLSPSANHQAHILRKEVWSQCKSRDCESAGRLPVREYAPGHAGSQGLLGECFWWSGWYSQPVWCTSHLLSCLRPIGSGTDCQLVTGWHQWQQLQVSTQYIVCFIEVLFVFRSVFLKEGQCPAEFSSNPDQTHLPVIF